MGFDLHTVDMHSGGTQTTQSDRLGVLMLTGVANVIGASAGAAVVTAVAPASGTLPAVYNVQVTPSQDARCYVSGKTSSGFNVTLLPGLAANTLAVGTFDVLVTY